VIVHLGRYGGPRIIIENDITACGYEGEVASTTDITMVNCPLCHMMVERVPVIPGQESTMRRSTPPAYLNPGAHYAGPFIRDGVRTAPEFAREADHRRRRVSARVKALIGVLVGLMLAAVMLAAVAGRAGAEDPDPSVGTPSPAGPPPVRTPPAPEEILGMEVIWTRAGR